MRRDTKKPKAFFNALGSGLTTVGLTTERKQLHRHSEHRTCANDIDIHSQYHYCDRLSISFFVFQRLAVGVYVADGHGCGNYLKLEMTG